MKKLLICLLCVFTVADSNRITVSSETSNIVEKSTEGEQFVSESVDTFEIATDKETLKLKGTVEYLNLKEGMEYTLKGSLLVAGTKDTLATAQTSFIAEKEQGRVKLSYVVENPGRGTYCESSLKLFTSGKFVGLKNENVILFDVAICLAIVASILCVSVLISKTRHESDDM